MSFIALCAQTLSCVWLFETPQTVAQQVPLSLEFSQQEYWSGLPFPSLGDLPDPGIKSKFLIPHALAGRLAPPGKPNVFLALNAYIRK